MALIYISSSYQDLKDYRRRAAETIRAIGHVPVGMEHDGAAERQPLNECLADVRKCHAYLGILGFRYGSTPPDEVKSYTELEYEEAGRLKEPCRLLFVANQDVVGIPPQFVDKDSGRIDAFRDLVNRTHTVASFSTPDEFANEVEKAVVNAVGRGREVPPLLPWLCDQSEQEEAIRAAMEKWEPRRPLVLIVHGDSGEHHRRFIDRLRERMIPQLLGLAAKTPLKEYELEWPETRRAEGKLSQWFAGQLAGSGGPKPGETPTLSGVLANLGGLRTPVLAWSVTVADEWRGDPLDVISRFVACWHECPDLPSDRPFIVCLAITYHAEGPGGVMQWLGWRRSIAARLRELETTELAAESRITQVTLPRLGYDAVKRQHVENWITREVKPLADTYAVDEDALVARIDELFSSYKRTHGTDLIPMKKLGEALKQALEVSALAGRKGRGLFA